MKTEKQTKNGTRIICIIRAIRFSVSVTNLVKKFQEVLDQNY